MTARMPLNIAEADFARTVYDLARLRGWMCYHPLPAVRRKDGQDRWATPLQGDAGWPDWAFARDDRLLIAELKSASGVASKAQRKWLAALGQHGRLWRPSDMTEIAETLR